MLSQIPSVGHKSSRGRHRGLIKRPGGFSNALDILSENIEGILAAITRINRNIGYAPGDWAALQHQSERG